MTNIVFKAAEEAYYKIIELENCLEQVKKIDIINLIRGETSSGIEVYCNLPTIDTNKMQDIMKSEIQQIINELKEKFNTL